MEKIDSVHLNKSYYNNCWRNADSFLMYKNKYFQFRTGVVIIELDYCLINPIANCKIYDAYNLYNIEPNKAFINYIRKESKDKSIIIISNINRNNKLLLDSAKKKMEFVDSYANIPIIGFFPLKKNKFSKPYAGIWKFIKYYFMSNNIDILRADVISYLGGDVCEREIKEKDAKEGVISETVRFPDTDRAFAHNIGANYISITEILEGKKVKFKWNAKTIDPEIRAFYAKEIEKYNRDKNYIDYIFNKMESFIHHDTFIILVAGAPRTGKTTLTKKMVEKWDSSKLGENHALEVIDYFGEKKIHRDVIRKISNRMSVLIDGNCSDSKFIKKMSDLAEEKNSAFIFIEVNPGIEMARIFNHVAVETATSDGVELYNVDVYDIYKANFVKPILNRQNEKYILYCPNILNIPEVMTYRY